MLDVDVVVVIKLTSNYIDMLFRRRFRVIFFFFTLFPHPGIPTRNCMGPECVCPTSNLPWPHQILIIKCTYFEFLNIVVIMAT